MKLIRIVSHDGTHEATLSRMQDGMILREGYWRVTYPSGSEEILVMDDMPYRWIEAARKAMNRLRDQQRRQRE